MIDLSTCLARPAPDLSGSDQNPADQDLADQARAARARGDHDAAIALWHRLLDRSPDDPALALELKQDLRAAYHYPEADPRFRRAARALPDEAWLSHFSSLYVFHTDELDAIDARARTLRTRWPGSSRIEAILGDVARQRRDWPEAERAFTEAHRLDPADAECAARADAARAYAALAAHPVPRTGPSYAIAVVNMDRNTERLRQVRAAFASATVPLRRIPAVEGSRLPATAVARLAGTPTAPRGTLGCFLSHAAAWESLLAGDDEALLVLEDDVIPLVALPDHLGGLDLPEGWDIVFVNDRLEPRTLPHPGQGFTTHTAAAALRAFHPEDNAPGADGYLVSRAGARRLLDWTAADGFDGDVDWRMVAYSLHPAEVAAIAEGSHAKRELQRLQRDIPRHGRLHAHVLHPALVRTVGISSDREDQNRLHKAQP